MPPSVDGLPDVGGVRLYAPGVAPLLQSLLATLADIDFAFESDVEVVEESAADESLKRKIVEKLREQHRKRRAPYVRQIGLLQQGMQPLVA